MIRPEPNPIEVASEASQERLVRENQELKRQVAELQALVPTPGHAPSHDVALWRPSRVTLWSLLLGVVVLLVLAFVTGFVPLQKRDTVLRAEAADEAQGLPRVEVITVVRASTKNELQLPGSIQAVTEAPILARADGYVRKRLVDIGDRVHAGQPVAEIEAPELGQQVLQANANLEQAQAALEQAQANYQQGKSNMELARITAQRWKALGAKGVVSRQENDQYQSQYQAQLSNLQALEKAISAQRSNIAAAEANLSRLRDMQGYRVVRAPFDGVITQRNVDVGALVNTGNTLLYRIAQTGTLRTYINVPQVSASSIHTGQNALLTVSNLPGRTFSGTVARTANSLDPATRTLLVELHVPNADGALLPGMYCQIRLNSPRTNPPILIPSDSLIVRTGGTLVAVVRPDHTIHLQPLGVGRDFGDRIEVLSGLADGDSIIPNPGDIAREGLKVDPVARSSDR
jgi:RND family efflux transporter MFP subunit